MYRRTFEKNYPLGRDCFMELLDRYGLKVRKRIRKPRTTDSTHGLPVFSNLIKEYIPLAPNRLWVSDITYIPLCGHSGQNLFCYLSLMLDAYTKEIVGWSVGPSLETEYPLAALLMALERLPSGSSEKLSLIHHSDRGCQYASSKYTETLRAHGIRISMTESGDPKENAQAERINNTMKNELLKDMQFKSIEEVKKAIAHAVEFYNNERPHMSLNMMTPREASQCKGEIPKCWTSYREKYINEKKAGANPEKSLPLHPCQGSPYGLRPPVNP